MEDLELLELAAKASGLEIMWPLSHCGDMDSAFDGYQACKLSDWSWWNPLIDDGDAFRMALKLQINIEYVPEMDSVMCSLPGAMGATSVAAIGDVELRYAIVQAAAQLGLTMP